MTCATKMEILAKNPTIQLQLIPPVYGNISVITVKDGIAMSTMRSTDQMGKRSLSKVGLLIRMKADGMIYCNDTPWTTSMVTGEDQCENQGYIEELCMEVGCCQWSLDPQLNIKQCMSAIGDFLCAADDQKNPSEDPSTDHNKSSGYEVYGVNTCGFGVKKWHKKTDVDVSFYLADDDIVQATVKEGGCHYFGHTTKEQPEYSTKGEGIDFQPTKWPDTFTCKGLKGTGEMIQELDNLCTDVEFPENACVVVVC